MGRHFTQGDYEGNFLRKVHKTENCWLWTASTKNGYGQYSSGYAHRYSYELSNGAINAGMYVLHRCNNKLCVNPEHLYLGTQQANINQAKSEYRLARGSKQGLAVLTEQDVIEIRRLRELGHMQTDLAVMFKVSQRLYGK